MATLILELMDDTRRTFESSNDWVTQAAQQARAVQGKNNNMFWFCSAAVTGGMFSVSGAMIRAVSEQLDP